MRYDKRKVLRNDREEIEDLLEARNRKFINHYETPELKFPTPKELAQLTIRTDDWKLGDRLYKYADKFYGDPQLWFIIAWFNNKPTEGHFKIGEIVEIPLPLEKIKKYLGL